MVYRGSQRLLGPAALSVIACAFLPACRCPSTVDTSLGAGGEDEYRLVRVLEVAGRQGIATDGDRYYVSGSTALYVYSKEGELLAANEEPFVDLAKPANHIGDISVHDGELFAGIEWFSDGRGTDIQIAVYDAETLRYKKSVDWKPESGQVEVSAVAVDAANGLVWMTDWVNGTHVYRYDMATGSYAGKLHIRPVPQWQQGIDHGFPFFTRAACPITAPVSTRCAVVRTSRNPALDRRQRALGRKAFVAQRKVPFVAHRT